MQPDPVLRRNAPDSLRSWGSHGFIKEKSHACLSCPSPSPHNSVFQATLAFSELCVTSRRAAQRAGVRPAVPVAAHGRRPAQGMPAHKGLPAARVCATASSLVGPRFSSASSLVGTRFSSAWHGLHPLHAIDWFLPGAFPGPESPSLLVEPGFPLGLACLSPACPVNRRGCR